MHGAAVGDAQQIGALLFAQRAAHEELARGANARDRPGSGLGLALARTIVARHGGDITLVSREGQGTRVRVSLPAHESHA